MYFQLRDKDKVTADIIEEKWKALDLPKEQFDELLKIGDLHGSFEWEKFLALAASALAEVNQIDFVVVLTFAIINNLTTNITLALFLYISTEFS